VVGVVDGALYFGLDGGVIGGGVDV